MKRWARTLIGLQDWLPPEISHALMCRRRVPHWRRSGVVFVHVPKAAGTSINHALYGRSLGHLKAREIERYSPGILAELPSFAVVRNPWSRLVSAYLFVKQSGTADAGVHRPGRYRAAAFRSFESFVEEWLAPRRLERLDYVFQPQHAFVDDAGGRQLVGFVGKLEQLSAVSDFLQQKLGRHIEFSRKNVSGAHSDYRSHFTSSRLQQRVAEIYAADVQRFAYDF
jgi:hypothetical protein